MRSTVTTLKERLVVGAFDAGNPYDGHTLREDLEQAKKLAEITPEMVFVDRCYQSAAINRVQIWEPGQR